MLRCSPSPLRLARLSIHSRADSASAEDKLLAVLKSGAAVGEKANACRELKLAGTEKSIPVLASLLTDAELSHPARFALESMPYPAAGAALRDALGKATGLTRAGIIDSLGQRRDPLAIPLVAPDLASKDIVLVAAAATALGKIGTSEAATATDRGTWRRPRHGTDQDRRWPAACCANRLHAVGLNREAGKIYAVLVATGRATPDPRGALHGQMEMAALYQHGVIGKSLADADPMVRSAAAAELHALSDADLGAIAADMAKLPPASQVSVLAAIRIRGHSARWRPPSWRRPRALTNRSAWRPPGR